MKKSKMLQNAVALMLTLSMVLSSGAFSIKANAEPADATTTLKTAFDSFNASGLVFIEYSLTGEGELIANEKVELDRAHNVKNILSQDVESLEWNASYTDIKEKITYYQDDDKKWYKYPTDAEELEGLGKTLSDNGVETQIVEGATYKYDGEEVVAVTNAHTDELKEVDCYRYLAEVPVVIKDDGEYEEGEEDADEEDEDGEDPDEEEQKEIINIYYYIDKATGRWVHADTKDGLVIDVDITYPSATGEDAVVLEIPKEAVDKAVLEDGYVTPTSSNELVGYKVVYKGKSAYLVVTNVKNSKKVTIKKSVKILGKTYPVKEIGASALANKSKIQTVVVNADITKIDKKAFYNSKKIKTITINSKKLKTIGKNAFDTNSKKLTIKLKGNKKYKTKVKKLITKSRAKKAVKKTKLTVK